MLPRKEKLFKIPLGAVERIERGMYDEKKFYMWYNEKNGTKSRVFFEMEDVVSATEIITKVKFICKCKVPTSN